MVSKGVFPPGCSLFTRLSESVVKLVSALGKRGAHGALDVLLCSTWCCSIQQDHGLDALLTTGLHWFGSAGQGRKGPMCCAFLSLPPELSEQHRFHISIGLVLRVNWLIYLPFAQYSS